MKLAVKKEPGHIPMSGYHYMLHPFKMDHDMQAAVFEQMGHIILDVPDEVGELLIKQACDALRHQVEIAVYTERALKKDKSV